MIYIPVSCRILTNGHIKCLRWLKRYKSKILIGLITDKGMRGYKDPIVPFKDRLEIMKVVAKGIGNTKVVPQHSLDPSKNIKRYKPTAIASGDGWEKSELEAIYEYKIKRIDIKLPKKYSSSKIIKKFCKIKVII